MGSKVKDLELVFDFIVAKIERGDKTIVPRGQTVIEENDLIILGGERHFDTSGHELVEFTLPGHHAWTNRHIKNLDLPPHRLIIMLQRKDGSIVVPSGDTLLLAGDKIITIENDHHLEPAE